MRPALIRKDPWAAARRALDGLPGGGLNIAHEAIVRHARGPLAGRIAIRWLDAAGGARELSYAELDAASSRFANLLRSLGVAKGDVVFVPRARPTSASPSLCARAGLSLRRSMMCSRKASSS